jgi:hypothetical protein
MTKSLPKFHVFLIYLFIVEIYKRENRIWENLISKNECFEAKRWSRDYLTYKNYLTCFNKLQGRAILLTPSKSHLNESTGRVLEATLFHLLLKRSSDYHPQTCLSSLSHLWFALLYISSDFFETSKFGLLGSFIYSLTSEKSNNLDFFPVSKVIIFFWGKNQPWFLFIFDFDMASESCILEVIIDNIESWVLLFLEFWLCVKSGCGKFGALILKVFWNRKFEALLFW